MKWTRCILLIGLAIAVVTSCTRLPQSTRSNEEMASLRAEYLNSHPNGKYNEHIMEGRVIKGMSILEVLASWGVPNLRRSWKHDTSEYWTYYAKDEHTQQVVAYDLVFEEKLLMRWIVNTEVAGSLGTAIIDPAVTRTVEETLRLGTAAAMTPGSSGQDKK